MVQGPPCANCRNTEYTKDDQTSELVCNNCGSVAEESRIVSEVSFSETASGRAMVTGQYVNNESSTVVGNTLHGMQSGDSRQQTIERAKLRLTAIGHELAVPEHVIEGAVRHFRIALAKNFVKGRKTQHVLTACLYLSCRIAKTHHMLMDFAQAIHVNVFSIGATYLQLVRSQQIENVPIVDPTIYLQRFVIKLQFDVRSSKAIINDAKLLVQRMGKDWLQQGRRPAGVAAACILLAARMNNFRRSKSEIVRVAKIAEETLQRRLDEFRETAAGTLTVQDFRNTNVESAGDPPAFTKARQREAKRAGKAKETAESGPSEVSELSEADLQKQRDLEDQVKRALQRNEEQWERDEDIDDPFLRPEFVAMAKELDQEDNAVLELDKEVEAALRHRELDRIIAEMQEKKDASKAPGVGEQQATRAESVYDSESDFEQGDENEDAEAESEAENTSTAEETPVPAAVQPAQQPVVRSGRAPLGAMEEDNESDIELDEDELLLDGYDDDYTDKKWEETLRRGVVPVTDRAIPIMRTILPGTFKTSQESSPVPEEAGQASSRLGPAAAFVESLRQRRAKRIAEQQDIQDADATNVPETEDSLSDVDDEEVDFVILTEEEIELKSMVWNSLHRDYLLDQERKRLRLEADQRAGIVRPAQKRRKPRSKQVGLTTADSAEANATTMLRERNHSKKINYAAVTKLFQ